MPEPRGSSFDAQMPLIHDPDSSNGRSAPDDAPTEIKPLSSSSGDDAVVEPNLADQELLGTTLDHFELLDCIGVGGMGRVYRARDNRLDRLVALKVLAPDLAKDVEICKRFEQEAKAAARLDDRHFARVYFFGEDKGLKYIAMEFVEGENLRRKIQSSGRLDYATVLNIGLQIARGLAHAASCGVVHRDIKPSNIVIAPTGTAKLVDMGLARSFFQSSSPASELTHAGVTLGTFDYISPEQARDPRDADSRSDIYSLGCTLYHALTGRPPFPEGTALQKLLQHQSDSVTDPRRLVAELPDPVVAVLMKMLAKNPKDRYQSPAELIHDLRAISRILDIPLPDEPGYLGEVGVGQTMLERQLVWLVPMLLFLAAIGGYTYVYRGRTVELRPLQLTSVPAPVPPQPISPKVLEPAPRVSSASVPTPPVVQPAREGHKRRDVLATDDLRQAVMDAEDGDELVLLGKQYDIQFTQSGSKLLRGIVIDKNLTLRGGSDGLTTIAIDDSREGSDGFSDLSLFAVQGADVAFEKLKFEVSCSGNAVVGINTLSLEDGNVRLADCNLLLRGGPKEGTPCAMVVAKNFEPSQKAKIVAHRCYFGGGQDGFRLGGQGDIDLELSNCAFEQFIHAFDVGGTGKMKCTMDHVSLFVGEGPVIKVSELRRATFDVADSVFSRLRNVKTSWPLVDVLVEGNPSIAEEPWWRGARNLFHGFDKSLLEVAKVPQTGRLEDLRQWGIDEEGSKELLQSAWPWALVDPKNPLNSEELTRNPVRVFRLRSDAEGMKLAEDFGPIGVRTSPWGEIYASDTSGTLAIAPLPKVLSVDEPPILPTPILPPETAKPVETQTVLIVDPLAQIGAEAGVYRRLSNACDEVPVGKTAVIELRTNETVEVGDVKLTGQNLTIRPGADFHPKMKLRTPVPGESSPPKMFQLTGQAKLRIYDVPLEMELTGWTSDGMGTALRGVFECDHDSSVELENLSVQLGKGSRAPTMSLFQAKAPAGSFLRNIFGAKTDRGQATLMLKRCEVRTASGLVVADPNAFWTVSVDSSFVAAEGTLLNIVGRSNAGGSNQANQFETRNSTYLLRDSLASLEVEGKMPDLPRRVEIVSDGCIFVGSGTSIPLTRCGGELDARAQKDAIRWTGSVNFFAGYSVLFYVSGASNVGMGMPTQPNAMDKDVWLKHWGLAGEMYYFGANDVGGLWTVPVWDQRVPTLVELRKLGYPTDFPHNIGVAPFFLPQAMK